MSNVIKSNVSILDQLPGIDGMKKHIERAARISYRSEGRITEDSYKKFIKCVLYDRGHWAAFNLGTVYLKITAHEVATNKTTENFYSKLTDFDDKRMSWNRVNFINDVYYITTNYRVICQLNAEKLMEKFWSEPTEHHYHRITSLWECSRGIAQQVLRHRVFSPLMESTRYVNFSLDKFTGYLSFTLPQWVYDVRENIIAKNPELSFLNDLDGAELWDELVKVSELVSRRDRIYNMMEEEYNYETSDDCELKLKPEDARDVLGLGLSTSFYLCGYVEDYCYVPEETSPEKAGLFFLRTAPDAQRDVRILAEDLKNQFESRGLDLLL